MRICVFTFAVVSAIAPGFAQQSGAQGVGNEKRMQDAVRNALQNTLRPPSAPAGILNVPLIKPKKFFVEMRLPAEMCAIPLRGVPIHTDPDTAIVLKNGASSTDTKMIVPPAVPVCPTNRAE